MNFLGVVLEECNEHGEAIKSFCKALDIDNDYEDARANLCFYTNDYLALEKLALAQENNFMLNLKRNLLNMFHVLCPVVSDVVNSENG